MNVTTIPGLRALWRFITDECRRNKGDDGAIQEVIEEVEKQLYQSLEGWPEGDGTEIHVVVTVKRGDSE